MRERARRPPREVIGPTPPLLGRAPTVDGHRFRSRLPEPGSRTACASRWPNAPRPNPSETTLLPDRLGGRSRPSAAEPSRRAIRPTPAEQADRAKRRKEDAHGEPGIPRRPPPPAKGERHHPHSLRRSPPSRLGPTPPDEAPLPGRAHPAHRRTRPPNAQAGNGGPALHIGRRLTVPGAHRPSGPALPLGHAPGFSSGTRANRSGKDSTTGTGRVSRSRRPGPANDGAVKSGRLPVRGR